MLSFAQLPVAKILQPLLKVDFVVICLRERRNLFRALILKRRRPAAPSGRSSVRRKMMGKSFEETVKPKPLAPLLNEIFEVVARKSAPPDLLERVPLHPGNGGIIHPIERTKRRQCIAADSGLIPIYLIDGDIERVQEPSRRRGKWAAPAGIGTKKRVERVQSDKVSTRSCQDWCKIHKIRKIADPPVAAGAQFVKLNRDPPRPTLCQPRR